MFEIKFFNQFGDYEEKTFNNRKSYIKFLKECEQNEHVQVLEFTDTYIEN